MISSLELEQVKDPNSSCHPAVGTPPVVGSRAMAYSLIAACGQGFSQRKVTGLNPEGLATIDVEIMKGNMR